jgi:hypothetical protein
MARCFTSDPRGLGCYEGIATRGGPAADTSADVVAVPSRRCFGFSILSGREL